MQILWHSLIDTAGHADDQKITPERFMVLMLWDGPWGALLPAGKGGAASRTANGTTQVVNAGNLSARAMEAATAANKELEAAMTNGR